MNSSQNSPNGQTNSVTASFDTKNLANMASGMLNNFANTFSKKESVLDIFQANPSVESIASLTESKVKLLNQKRCTRDSDCSGLFGECFQSYCALKGLDTCYKDADCAALVGDNSMNTLFSMFTGSELQAKCKSSRCFYKKPEDGHCSSYIQCEGDKYCDRTTSKCKKRVSYGSKCDSFLQCKQGLVCDDGTCKELIEKPKGCSRLLASSADPHESTFQVTDFAVCSGGVSILTLSLIGLCLLFVILLIVFLVLKRRKRKVKDSETVAVDNLNSQPNVPQNQTYGYGNANHLNTFFNGQANQAPRQQSYPNPYAQQPNPYTQHSNPYAQHNHYQSYGQDQHQQQSQHEETSAEKSNAFPPAYEPK